MYFEPCRAHGTRWSSQSELPAGAANEHTSHGRVTVASPSPAAVIAALEDGPPPPFVAEIPAHGLAPSPSSNVRLGCQPSSRRDQGRVNRIAQVMPGTIGDEANESAARPIGLPAQRVVQQVTNPLHDVDVPLFRVAAHGIGLSQLPALEHAEKRRAWSSTNSQSRTFSPLPYTGSSSPAHGP